MKKLNLLLLGFLLPIIILAQEKPKAIDIVFGGYVRNDIIFNTRQISSARGESQFSLVPLPVEFDANNQDINGSPNFNMAVLNTRVNMKITGPEAFGAKTFGFIEADFLGISVATKFGFRVRHAFINLDWGKTKLLSGMYWHPMFITDCYPGTVSFNTGVPFNPLSRAPQLRLTRVLNQKLSIYAALLSQGHFASVAPVGAAQNSAIPELHCQLQYKTDKIATGLGANLVSLKPALSSIGADTAGNPIVNKSNAKVYGLSFVAYLKAATKPLLIKAYGKYGQLDDHMVMMGGYSKVDLKNLTPQQIADGYVEYAPLNMFSAWIDFCTTGKKVKYGLFAGFAKNLGASKEIVSGSFSGRWGNVNSMMRVSPRVMFTSNKTDFGFEVEYSTVEYAKLNAAGLTLEEKTGINSKGQVTNFQLADNVKFLFSMTYNF